MITFVTPASCTTSLVDAKALLVPAGPAGFLLIVFDRFRHGRVQHEADVRTVDTHAESHGGHDQIALLGREGLLRGAAHVGSQPGMIREHIATLLLEELRQIIAVSTPRARPEVSVGQPVGVALAPEVCVVLGK